MPTAPSPQVLPQGADEPPSLATRVLRWALLLALLFGFLVAIELMSKAIQLLAGSGLSGAKGSGYLADVHNPFAGLAMGVLFTVLLQSSSTTTATIVAVVGGGALSVQDAVPMIMGANIGTTITNTIVSLGSLRRRTEFRRAFAAATVHDFFNLLSVLILLPLELSTRFLSRTAAELSSHFKGAGGGEFHSPIKGAIKTVYKGVLHLGESAGLSGKPLAIAALVVGIALTFASLYFITRTMRLLLAGRIEAAMNRALDTSGFVPLLIGLALTVAVQSSSITTSMLVPLCASGVLSLGHAFPIVLGANLGTTATALLASAAQERPEALTIAFVHLLFNVSGILIFYPIPAMRRLPLGLAVGLATLADRSRLWVLAYVVGVFILLPALGWFIWHTR
ncbi:MAG: Na/Pi symporter [Planctomycetota bacterium]